MKVLIIEDEMEISKRIFDYLKRENYFCELAGNIRTAREKIESFEYDCILLDINLPDGSGLTILKELRENKKTAGVIIISEDNLLDNRITGLNLGADDFLAKPFYLAELSARVAAVIRRRRFDGKSVIILNEITIDTIGKIIAVHNVDLDLTQKEYNLLVYFVVNMNRIISKNELAEHIT